MTITRFFGLNKETFSLHSVVYEELPFWHTSSLNVNIFSRFLHKNHFRVSMKLPKKGIREEEQKNPNEDFFKDLIHIFLISKGNRQKVA